MRTNITLEETEIALMLNQIIDHVNKEDMVLLLTGMICGNSMAVERFTKCFIGTKLPEVLPIGTIVTISIDDMMYDADKKLTKESNLNIGDKRIVGKITAFRGFHDYSSYIVAHKAIDKDGNEIVINSFVDFGQVQAVEDF